MPSRLQQFRDSWARFHPEWQMRLWTRENLPNLTNHALLIGAATGAQQSHIARYEILHKFGGVYVDLDVECRRSIDDLLPGRLGFAAAEDNNTVGVAVLASVAGSPLLGRVISSLPESLQSEGDPPTKSGSRFFTKFFMSFSDWHLMHWKLFYPYHWSGRLQSPIEEAYAVHNWDASWRP